MNGTGNDGTGPPLNGNPNQANGHDCEQTNGHKPVFNHGDPYHEPIAIVGMACRLPGGIASDEQLWDFLCEGRSAQGDAPPSRYNIDAFYNPLNNLPDTIPVRGGYFIDEDLRLFENSFFNINNLEATGMDPQQRKLLEVCFECLENAGIRDYAGGNIGCYVGNFAYDYQSITNKDPGYRTRLTALGLGTALLSNRVSYALDLRGPSLTLDTACSSSLYCLHLAVKALRQNECDAAIVAGANLIQSHEQTMMAARLGVLSRTSTCHTFDASADGYGRADGVGALYIKRLSDAIRDGDPIRSIIRGTAINSNGRSSNGITVPSGRGQCEVIAKAYEDAGIDPAFTDYIECHGTGTQVGDPIEVAAVVDSMRSRTLASEIPIFMGSVKTNLGHSEALSGITSVMKTTLALERGWIPPTIGVTELNPNVNWRDSPAQVVTSGMSWPIRGDGCHSRRASVNSFGYGGSNAHCILERYAAHYDPASTRGSHDDHTYPVLLPLSAATLYSLRQRAQDLSQTPGLFSIRDLAHTLVNRRSQLPSRGFIVAENQNWQRDIVVDNFERSCIQTSGVSRKSLAYIFTGQGAQWPGMGKQLFARFPVFRNRIQQLDEALSGIPNPPKWSLTGLITESEGAPSIHMPICSQTACTALQIGVVDLLREWKVLPRYVIGHSSGEIAAAYAAGHISANQAIVIAYGRGLIVSEITAAGAMIAVGAGEDEAVAVIQRLNLADRVCIACINSPDNVTISGDELAIEQLTSDFNELQMFVRKVKTHGKAYHSHHMKMVGALYQQYLESFLPDALKSNNITGPTEMISTVHNRIVDQHETATASYWRQNLESPVRFQHALETLQTLETCQMIEIGPHSALELPIKQTLPHMRMANNQQQSLYLASVIRNQESDVGVLTLAGRLWCHGYDVDLNCVNTSARSNVGKYQPRVLHNIPKYSWCYGDPLWSEPRRSKEYRCRLFAHDELLGTIMPGMNGSTYTWRNQLTLNEVPWLADHRVGHEVVFPGAAYVDMVLKAFQQIHPVQSDDMLEVRDMRLLQALALAENVSVEIFTELQPQALSSVEVRASSWNFTISSWVSGQVVKRAVGTVTTVPLKQASSPLDDTLKAQTFCDSPQTGRNWYRQLSHVGMQYGPKFRMLDQVWHPRMRDSLTCKARLGHLTVPLDPYQGSYRYRVHPVVLDAQLQTGLIATTRGNLEALEAMVPTVFQRIRVFPHFSHDLTTSYEIWTHGKSVAAGLSICNTKLVNEQGQTLIDVSFDAAWYSAAPIPSIERHPLLRIEWVPDLSCIGPRQARSLAAALADQSTHPSNHSAAHTEFLRLLYFAGLGTCDARVLVIASTQTTELIWHSYGGGTAYPRFSDFTFARINEKGVLEGSIVNPTYQQQQQQQQQRLLSNDLELTTIPTENMYDIIVVLDEKQVHSSLRLPDRLASDGIAFYSRKLLNDGDLVIDDSMISITTGQHQDIHIVKHRRPNGSIVAGSSDSAFVIITDGRNSSFDSFLIEQLLAVTGSQPLTQRFEQVDIESISTRATVIVTAELQTPVLTVASPGQLRTVQLLSSRVQRLLWVVGGNLHDGQCPDMAAALGLARAVMLEQPAVIFQVLGLESVEGEDAVAAAVECVQHVLQKPTGYDQDQEFLQHHGLLYVSRCKPDEELNRGFNQKKNAETEQRELRQTEFLRLEIEMPGRFDTLRFEELMTSPECPDGNIELQVMAIGINAKDVYTLSGKVKTAERSFAIDYSGIVRKVRAGCKLAVGDRVTACFPGPFGTVVNVPETVCIRMQDEESFTQMATVPVAFATALHALVDWANLQSDQTILIHSAAGGVGMAAIQIAKMVGATIYATVGNDEKRDFLVREFGIPVEHIFYSRDTSFLQDIKRVTNGRGVDVVLNSLTGDRLQAGIEACTAYGRFIELGKKDMMDGSNLNLASFGRGLTFYAWDMSDYCCSREPKLIRYMNSLLQRAVDLYRSHPVPAPQVFTAGRLPEAFRTFANSKRIGKVCVSFEKPETLVRVQPTRFRYRFSQKKGYLLVGCLGGLGRSLTRYMLENGARHFIFLGRSGTDRAAARSLVDDLRDRGASVQVVRGDVQDFSAVLRAIQGALLPVGGVVQAAMGLGESLFDKMTHDKWHSSIGPKIQGTWNIHRALEGHESQLDFFLVTSSLAGSMGTATESNYCTANSFLDYFAKYRRKLGKPATAIGFGSISEIGYLHEHPIIEEMLERRGLTALTEADFLDICDLALCSNADQPGRAHILTGIEGTRKISALKQGYQGAALPEMADPRLSILMHGERRRILNSGGVDGNILNGARGEHGLPAAVRTAMHRKDHSATLEAVAQVLAEKLSHLILMPVDQIPQDLMLASVGMDSMLAAEYRSFIFHTFKMDIPFLTLMDPSTTMGNLVVLIADELSKQ